MYDNYYYEQPPTRKRNSMATAAILLGIASLALCSVFYIAVPCGALAVICAILSRGSQEMTIRSRTGILCGIAGIIVSLILTASAFYDVLTDEDTRDYVEYYYRLYTGDYSFDLEETLEEVFPFLDFSDSDSKDRDSQNDGSNNSDDNSLQQDPENSHGGHNDAAPEDPDGTLLEGGGDFI